MQSLKYLLSGPLPNKFGCLSLVQLSSFTRGHPQIQEVESVFYGRGRISSWGDLNPCPRLCLCAAVTAGILALVSQMFDFGQALLTLSACFVPVIRHILGCCENYQSCNTQAWGLVHKDAQQSVITFLTLLSAATFHESCICITDLSIHPALLQISKGIVL